MLVHRDEKHALILGFFDKRIVVYVDSKLPMVSVGFDGYTKTLFMSLLIVSVGINFKKDTNVE